MDLVLCIYGVLIFVFFDLIMNLIFVISFIIFLFVSLKFFGFVIFVILFLLFIWVWFLFLFGIIFLKCYSNGLKFISIFFGFKYL